MNTRLESLFCAVLFAAVATVGTQFLVGVERVAASPAFRAAVAKNAPKPLLIASANVPER